MSDLEDLADEFLPDSVPDTLKRRKKPMTWADRIAKRKALFVPQTHCKRGHEFTKDNTYVYRGYRVCKACDNIRHQKGKS